MGAGTPRERRSPGRSTAAPARPQRGDELELEVDSLAFGGEGVARLGDARLRGVRGRARSPATACAPSCTSASAPTPTRARWRCSRRAPKRIAPRAITRGCPGRCSPTSASSRSSTARSREALRADRRPGGLRARGDRAGARTVALPQQARVLVRQRRRGRAACAAFTRRRRGNAVADGRLPARLRARQPRARARAGVVPRAGPAARGSGARRGRDAASRSGPRPTGACGCATSSSARVGAPAACRSGSSPPTASSTPAPLAAALARGPRRRARGRAVDALGPARRDHHGGDTELVWGEDELPERLGELDLRISARGVLPDQHRDGRGALRGGRASTPRSRAGSACTTSTAGSARSR